jgi:hypothetical protein
MGGVWRSSPTPFPSSKNRRRYGMFPGSFERRLAQTDGCGACPSSSTQFFASSKILHHAIACSLVLSIFPHHPIHECGVCPSSFAHMPLLRISRTGFFKTTSYSRYGRGPASLLLISFASFKTLRKRYMVFRVLLKFELTERMEVVSAPRLLRTPLRVPKI